MAGLSQEEAAAAQMIADQVNAGGDLNDLIASNPEMMQGLMAKLAGMEGMSSEYLESLPKAVKRRVKGLKMLQSEAVKLEVVYQREIQKLDRQFAPQFDAIYAKRAAIVAGAYEPTDEECAWVDEDEDEDEAKVVDPEDEPEEPTTGIPDFWLGCLSNNELTHRLIADDDVEILSHLINIEMEYSGADTDEDSFTLKFTFAPNEFMEETVLTKQYIVDVDADEKELMYSGPSYRRAEGCAITWKDGKNPTVKTVRKKQRKKGGSGAGKTRTVTKTEPQESFFNFFAPPAPPPEDIDVETMTEQQEQEFAELHNALFQDFELADAFKEAILPSAVMWFTGEADDEEDRDEEDRDDDLDGPYGGDGDGGFEDDDEDDEADPNYKPPDNAPECKQS